MKKYTICSEIVIFPDGYTSAPLDKTQEKLLVKHRNISNNLSMCFVTQETNILQEK